MSLPREDRPAAIRAALAAALAPTTLELVDDSHRHAGHAGARDGRGHFSLLITSAAFAGLAPLARHRRVYAALGELMQTDIHALAIDARAPGEEREALAAAAAKATGGGLTEYLLQSVKTITFRSTSGDAGGMS